MAMTPSGNAHAPDQQTVGTLDHALDLAHGVGQGGHVPAGSGHGIQAAVGDAQAVDAGLVQSARTRGVQVQGVGLENFPARLGEQVGQNQKRLVARVPSRRGQRPRGGPCRRGQFAHL
jgi:hypothetical protein